MTFSISRWGILALTILLVSMGIIATPLAANAAVGTNDLVKCPDFSAVYYIGDDGNRYTFPNDRIFFTWYDGFDDVKEISCERLGKIRLKGNVPYAAGTRLVKIPSVNKVYAVESDGVLRPIASEQQAARLFGDDWAQRIDDLSEAFFPRYTVGEELGDDELPEGTVVEDGDGLLFRYDEDGVLEEIDDLLSDQERRVLRRHAHKLSHLEARLEHKLDRIHRSQRHDQNRARHARRLKAIHFGENVMHDVRVEIPELSDDIIDQITDFSVDDDMMSDGTMGDDVIDEALDDFQEGLDEVADELTRLLEASALNVDMAAGNFFFEPSTINAHPGQIVRINFESNSGTHFFDIDELNIHKQIIVGDGVEFFAPTTPGRYVYYCSLGSHRSRGMEGVLIVE